MEAIKDGWMIHPQLDVFVSGEDIDDIMSSALDYIIYWCSEAEVIGDYLGEYASEQISRGGTLRLHDVEEDYAYFDLDICKLLTGIQRWLEAGGDRYGAYSDGRLDCCNIDGPMADEIVQYAIFGEIIYA